MTPESDNAALGEFLRQARERRGLTLQQISKETRIPWRHLDALEHGNLAAIPGGFYRRAEIRAYAEVVHLDQNLALARLDRAIRAPAMREGAPETPRTEQPALFRKHELIAVAIVAAIVMFGLVAWVRSPMTERGVQTPATSPQSAEAPALTAPIARDVVGGQATPVPVDRTITGPAEASAEGDSDGELIVSTEPAGSRVTIDGIGWGVTPVTIRHLPLGAKRIRVTKDGYAAAERVVELAADRSTIRLKMTLRSLP